MLLIARGDQVHVDAKEDRCRRRGGVLFPAGRVEFLRLHPLRQVGDLVQEQRRFVGALYKPYFALGGAGEGAALVAEQFVFDQGVGDREQLIATNDGPRAATTDGSRGPNFLAGPALALDKDGRVRGRDPPHQPDHFQDAVSCPTMPSISNVPSSRRFSSRFSCCRFANSAASPTLVTSVSRSVGFSGSRRRRPSSLDGAVGRAVRRQHHHLAAGIGAAHFREQLLARHPRHHEVGQHDVETRQRQQLDRALADSRPLRPRIPLRATCPR